MINLLMKKTLAVFVFLSICHIAPAQGYEIRLTLKPYTNSKVYLGYYYGKLKAVADSAILNDQSACVFTGKDKLPGGIYFVVSPKKEILFELLVDQQQKFSVTADTARIPAGIHFTGSPENDAFLAYTMLRH